MTIFVLGFILGDLVVGTLLNLIADRLTRGRTATTWDTAVRQSADTTYHYEEYDGDS
jgi:hypothetical protein